MTIPVRRKSPSFCSKAGKKSKIKITVHENEKDGTSVVTFKNSAQGKRENFGSVMKVIEEKLD